MLTIDISAGVNVQAGLGRYTRSLVDALLPYTTPQVFYNNIPGRTQPQFEQLTTHSINLGYKPWRMAVYMGQRVGLPYNRLVPRTTIFHATEHLLMPLRGVKTVLTVHDLIYKLFPEHHKKLNYWYLNAAMPLFVKRADAIITISESSKQDLISHYGTPAKKIHVIYEAAAAHFQPQSDETVQAVKQRYHLPEQYLLVVGTIEPRKNYSRLVEALMHLRHDYPELALVVVGSKGWLYESFFAQIKELQAPVVFPGYIPDQDLPAVYAGAMVAVMASIYEGFGLPILEAMACGTPVAASHAASLPELGGEAAVYFDPYEVSSMVDALQKLLNDASLREKYAQMGLVQAAKFSWDRTARETLAVYSALGFEN